MANIGQLKLQDNGTYIGELHTLKHHFQLQLLPCESKSGEHPVYRAWSGKAELGAAWENEARETGMLYYTLRLNDPSFERPLYAKLFQDRDRGMEVLHIVFD